MLAGSGTAVWLAPVMTALMSLDEFGSKDRSFTLRKNEPVAVPLVNVKSWGVLLKSIKTPPELSLSTDPMRVAIKTVLLPPVRPGGAVKLTRSENVLPS